MAIEYDLDVATPLSAMQVAHGLHGVGRALGLMDALVTPNLLLDGAVTELNMWIRVFEARPRPTDAITTSLGFTRTVTVIFRLRKVNVAAQEDEMVRLTDGLLNGVPGDAVLHWQFETIWLLRRGNDLSVSEQADLWPPNRLAALTQPYSRTALSFLE